MIKFINFKKETNMTNKNNKEYTEILNSIVNKMFHGLKVATRLNVFIMLTILVYCKHQTPPENFNPKDILSYINYILPTSDTLVINISIALSLFMLALIKHIPANVSEYTNLLLLEDYTLKDQLTELLSRYNLYIKAASCINIISFMIGFFSLFYVFPFVEPKNQMPWIVIFGIIMLLTIPSATYFLCKKGLDDDTGLLKHLKDKIIPKTTNNQTAVVKTNK
jgi:hypothetical protein